MEERRKKEKKIPKSQPIAESEHDQSMLMRGPALYAKRQKTAESEHDQSMLMRGPALYVKCQKTAESEHDQSMLKRGIALYLNHQMIVASVKADGDETAQSLTFPHQTKTDRDHNKIKTVSRAVLLTSNHH